jgi:hypothetical protein
VCYRSREASCSSAQGCLKDLHEFFRALDHAQEQHILEKGSMLPSGGITVQNAVNEPKRIHTNAIVLLQGQYFTPRGGCWFYIGYQWSGRSCASILHGLWHSSYHHLIVQQEVGGPSKISSRRPRYQSQDFFGPRCRDQTFHRRKGCGLRDQPYGPAVHS